MSTEARVSAMRDFILQKMQVHSRVPLADTELPQLLLLRFDRGIRDIWRLDRRPRISERVEPHAWFLWPGYRSEGQRSPEQWVLVGLHRLGQRGVVDRHVGARDPVRLKRRVPARASHVIRQAVVRVVVERLYGTGGESDTDDESDAACGHYALHIVLSSRETDVRGACQEIRRLAGNLRCRSLSRESDDPRIEFRDLEKLHAGYSQAAVAPRTKTDRTRTLALQWVGGAVAEIDVEVRRPAEPAVNDVENAARLKSAVATRRRRGRWRGRWSRRGRRCRRWSRRGYRSRWANPGGDPPDIAVKGGIAGHGAVDGYCPEQLPEGGCDVHRPTESQVRSPSFAVGRFERIVRTAQQERPVGLGLPTVHKPIAVVERERPVPSIPDCVVMKAIGHALDAHRSTV